MTNYRVSALGLLEIMLCGQLDDLGDWDQDCSPEKLHQNNCFSFHFIKVLETLRR